MYMPTKNYFNKKANKLCLMGQIVIESPSFLEYWQNHVGIIQNRYQRAL